MFGKRKDARDRVNPAEAYLNWTAKPTALAEIMDFKVLLQQAAFQDFYRWAMTSQENGRKALEQVAGALAQMDAFQSALAAHLCGALIEHWGMDKQAGRKIVEAFAENVRQACAFLAAAEALLVGPDEALDAEKLEEADMAALFAQTPEATRAYWGSDLMALAAMAVITRDQGARYYLRELDVYPYIHYLGQFKDKLQYVVEVYQACAQLSLTILSPKTRHGLRVVASDLSNCFHLFTLLEAELYRQGLLADWAIMDYAWREGIYQIAIGAQYPQRQDSITAHQQYYTVQAVLPDGSYQVTKETEQGVQMDPEALVWGEMPPEAIAPFNGERVLICDQEGMFAGRSWDVSFITKCHDALKPSLQITEVLSEADCRELWERIKQNRG